MTSAQRIVATVASITFIKSAGAFSNLFNNLLKNNPSPAVGSTVAALPGFELPTNPPT